MGSHAIRPRLSIRVRRTVLAVVTVLAAFVPGGSSASAATSPPTVVLTFDDIDMPKRMVALTDQYTGRGVTVQDATAYDVTTVSGLARSGNAVAATCPHTAGCPPMTLRFAKPQVVVRMWVGAAAGPTTDADAVTLTALDANGTQVASSTVTPLSAAAAVGVRSATSSFFLPVWSEVEVASSAGTIRSVTLGWAKPGGAPAVTTVSLVPTLVVDDVTLVGPLATLTSQPSTVDFGPVREGSPAAHRSVKVTNTGNVDVTLGQPAVSGDEAFTVSGCAKVLLKPGKRCTLDVRFLPGTPGRSRATVRFPGSGTTLAMGVRARVTAPPPPPPPPTSPTSTTSGPRTPTETPTTPHPSPTPTPPIDKGSGLVSTLVRDSPFIAFVMVVGALAYLFGTRATRRVSDRRTPPAPPPTHLVTTDARTTQRMRSEPPPVVVLTYDRADAAPDWRQ